MDSKTKIGLLIGLVILFFIVFMLNGLPRIGDARESDELPMFVDSEPLGIIPEMPPEVFQPKRVSKQHPKDTPPPKDQQQFRVELEEYSLRETELWASSACIASGSDL